MEGLKGFRNVGLENNEVYMYLYRFTFNQKVYSGIVCSVDIEQYHKKNIKPHEHIRVEKLKELKGHIKESGIYKTPVILLYEDKISLDQWINHYLESHQADSSFIDEVGNTHEIFKIKEDADIIELEILLKRINTLYIADGHHRMEVTLELAEEMKQSIDVLSILFSQQALSIWDYNVVIKDNNSLSRDKIFQLLEQRFNIVKVHEKHYKPKQSNMFGMRYDKEWYQLTLKEEYIQQDMQLKEVGSWLLYHHILEPIFGVEDVERDLRINFVEGSRGLDTLNMQTNQECEIGFSVFPVNVYQVMELAKGDILMPPKTTWFEPKLREGIFRLQAL